MIELKRYDNVSRFKHDVVPFLERWEGENNLPLGIILQLKPERKPFYMGTVQKDGELVLVFYHFRREDSHLKERTGVGGRGIAFGQGSKMI
ncbi:hypothetical protein [Anoxybacteroides tepidamans]|uniref:hypothetical protein n=1 Tax=Anoxybacteroides tepidamans TaxID=265948 RepID=UPI0004807288|nr:hypothetical protein [Anoxybacillus tepidamans]